MKNRLDKYAINRTNKENIEMVEKKSTAKENIMKESSKKIALIKEKLLENVNLDAVKAKPEIENDDAKEDTKKVEVKNAFDILLKSYNGGTNTIKTPRRKKQRKKIGLRTPQSSGKNILQEWLKRK